MTTATMQTVAVVEEDRNWGVGGPCDAGNRREAFSVQRVAGEGTCELFGWARLTDPNGNFEMVSDPTYCGTVLFTLGTVSCRVTLTQRRVCP